MTELEQTLSELARELDYPPTPRLAAAIERRLQAERPARPLRKRRLAVALVIALLLPAAGIAAVPSIRHAVLKLVGIRGVQIVRTLRRPSAPAAGKLSPGRPITLAQAGELLRFRIRTPRVTELGAPTGTYYRSVPAGGALSLVYRPRAGIPRPPFTRQGLLLTEFLGSDATVFARKFVGPGTHLESVKVNGQPGVWLAGEPHQFAYVDARGQTQTETLRLAGNTLLWQRGRLTLRIEGAISKQNALSIARSVR